MSESVHSAKREHSTVLEPLQQPTSSQDQKLGVTQRLLEILAPSTVQPSSEQGEGSAPAIEPGDTGTYKELPGTPFHEQTPGGPEIELNDVRQGQLGDCYFVAVLGAVARVRPDIIRDMIKDNNDGTYTVTFHDIGIFWDSTDVVTVDSNFFLDSSGNPIYAKTGDGGHPDGPELWVMIIEKAWAQLHGGYGEITGKNVDGDAWSAVTGHNADHERPGSLGSDEEMFNRIKSHFVDNNKPIIFWSIDAGDSSKKEEKQANDGVIGNHEYPLNNVNVAAQTVDLYNPWGRKHLNGKDMAFIKQHFQRVRFLEVP